MSTETPAGCGDVVDACRLVMASSANEYAKLAVISALLTKAPPPLDGPDSVRLFVDALKEINGKLEVAA